jgi:type IV pilus assembly protein PilM
MKRLLLGLDIGSRMAKIVLMGLNKKNRKRTVRILDSHTTSIPPGSVVDGEIIDPVTVASVIKSCLQASRIRVRRVVLALNGSRVILKQLDFPPLSKVQIRQSLQWEIDRYTPYSAQDTEFNFISLKRTPKKHTILLAASPKRIVQALISTVELIRMRPLLIEPGILALFRWVQYRWPDQIDGLVLCDFGASSADILIVANKQPVMARTVVMDGDQDTIEQGLFTQVKQSLDFASRQHCIIPDSHLFCAGGGSKNSSFASKLAFDLGLKLLTREELGLPDPDMTLFGTGFGLGLGWWGGGV